MNYHSVPINFYDKETDIEHTLEIAITYFDPGYAPQLMGRFEDMYPGQPVLIEWEPMTKDIKLKNKVLDQRTKVEDQLMELLWKQERN